MRSIARLTRADPPPSPRKAVVHEATTGHPPNEVTCDEVKGAADLRNMISELVVGQKILADSMAAGR